MTAAPSRAERHPRGDDDRESFDAQPRWRGTRPAPKSPCCWCARSHVVTSDHALRARLASAELPTGVGALFRAPSLPLSLRSPWAIPGLSLGSPRPKSCSRPLLYRPSTGGRRGAERISGSRPVKGDWSEPAVGSRLKVGNGPIGPLVRALAPLRTLIVVLASRTVSRN